MSVLTANSVRVAERRAVDSGIFSFTSLMKIAGESVAKEIATRYDVKMKKIAVVCGKGNNGGDGFVCAKALSEIAKVTLILPFGEPQTPDAEKYYGECENLPIEKELSGEYDFIIDAVFGIGLNREVNAEYKSIIEKINSRDAVKISIDVPSGANCDTGEVLPLCVNADLTITFIAYKPCHLLPPASNYCGEVCLVDIGVNDFAADYQIIKPPKIEKRAKNSHKGSFGTGVAIAGSYGMCGAAMLAAKGALRNGIGILKAVINEKIYAPFTVGVPEAVCLPVENFDDEKILPFIENANAILIGCGMGNNEQTKNALDFILANAKAPLIIDADGINVLSSHINILREFSSPIIITPHSGEMARIFGVSAKDIEQNRIHYAKRLAEETQITVVLKGTNTIVATKNGKIYFNITGNPGMATGGSGDVLGGIILSLLSRGFSPEDAAMGGVYLHGAAGDKAKEFYGEEGMLPSDIVNNL